MDLSTKYAGLELKNPVVVSSSKITSSASNIKKCAELGAGAVVLKSVFEEQILESIQEKLNDEDMYFWFPEAEAHVKSISSDQGVKQYLQLVQDAKNAADIPIIASVNCIEGEKWVDFAAQIEEAGADALELNVSLIPYDHNISSQAIEDNYKKIVSNVVSTVNIPVTVKMGSYFTNIIRVAKDIQDAGASGIVVFNRYYRPDIDIESLEVVNHNYLSSPEEITQSLRWVSLLFDKLDMDIAASTGIHSPEGVVKQLLAGAASTQICSTLYKNGIEQLSEIIEGLEQWMDRKGFKHIRDFRGKVGGATLQKAAFERMQFMERTLS